MKVLTNPQFLQAALQASLVLGAVAGWVVTGMLKKAGLEPSDD